MTTAQHCGNCGTALRTGAPFCPACGTKVEDANFPPPVYVAPTAPTRRSSTFYLAIGGVVAVVGVVAALLLLGGGGSDSGGGNQVSAKPTPGDDQPPARVTPAATATQRPGTTPVATTVAATPTPVVPPTPAGPSFDPARGDQLSRDVINAAARLRGPNAEGPTSLPFSSLAVHTPTYQDSNQAACAQVAASAKLLQQGRRGTTSTAFFKRTFGPGNVPGNFTGIGTSFEGIFAEASVYDNATQVTGHIDRTRTLILSGNVFGCLGLAFSTVRTPLPPTLQPGPGGYAWGYDESFTTTRGTVNSHQEEYVWQVDNLLIRVQFSGEKAFFTPDRIRDGLTAMSDAARQVSGR